MHPGNDMRHLSHRHVGRSHRRPASVLAFAFALALGGCAFAPAERIGDRKAPTASPGCDIRNVCRVYVALERDSDGTDRIHVYPDTLYTNTGRRDVHVVWIILNDGVQFRDDRNIAIQQGDKTQWTDKYATDDDEGARPGANYRPKNFHGRFPMGAKAGTYKYAVTVQKGNEPPITKDPLIINSN